MILLAETEKGHATELAVEAEGKLLMKAAKQRKESAEIFPEEGRADLAQRENFQLEIISRYLQSRCQRAEITQALKSIIEQVGAKVQRYGQVMNSGRNLRSKPMARIDF